MPHDPQTTPERPIYLTNGETIYVPDYPLWGISKWDYMAALVPPAVFIASTLIAIYFFGWNP